MPKRRITAGGEIVEVDEEAPAPKETTSSSSPWSTRTQNPLGGDSSGEERYNVLGFSLDRRQLAMALLFGFFFFSLRGMLIMMAIHFASRYFAKRRSESSSTGMFGSNSSSSSSSSQHPSKGRSTGRKSNVHGMSDLPSDPRRG